MSPVAPRRPGGASPLTSPFVIVGAVVLAIGVILFMGARGIIELPGFGPREPSTAGLIAVPSPGAIIPAFTRVRRDHLWDARNRRLSMIYLPPQAVSKEMIVNISDIIGRVLESEKEPGYVFTASDFLPAGTREGIVAGIPAGKRAIRVSADNLDGLYGLHAGDRFDILATLPISAAGGRPFNLSGPYSQELALQAQLSNWDKQATVRVIVQSAVIIEPMRTRAVPLYQSGAGESATTRARAVQEAVIAVNPEEVALLSEAMAVEARLTSIPRSGRPDDPEDSTTPDLVPFSPYARPGTGDGAARATPESAFTMVETIAGQKKSVMAIPRN